MKRSKNCFAGTAHGLVLLLSGLTMWCLVGCEAPDTPSLTPSASVADKYDPFEFGASDGDYDPPPLLAAIEDDELDRVRTLLAEGADVNQHDPIYGTPLVNALQLGDEQIVSTLLEAGAKRSGAASYFLEAADLPEKNGDPKLRAVVDAFADDNELTIREHDQLSALLVCEVPTARGTSLVAQYQSDLQRQGWFLFKFSQDTRLKQDLLGLLATRDKYVVLAYLQTDGINYNINTERIITWLRHLEGDHPFELSEIGLDYVGGVFLQRIARPGRLARQMFAFCPDIVDQGVMSVANLEKELAKPSPQLYLWWD